jgi:uncharacterized protein YggU (UPF0235/DUF167 family)
VTRLEVWVVPRSPRDEVGGEHDGLLVVRTTAPPADGKANAAVCALVARHLGVPFSSVDVVRGHRSRRKVLSIPD